MWYSNFWFINSYKAPIGYRNKQHISHWMAWKKKLNVSPMYLQEVRCLLCWFFLWSLFLLDCKIPSWLLHNERVDRLSLTCKNLVVYFPFLHSSPSSATSTTKAGPSISEHAIHCITPVLWVLRKVLVVSINCFSMTKLPFMNLEHKDTL